MKKPIPFGKYYLLDRINVGGMAEVFRAKIYGVEDFERLIAIKRILPNIAEDEEFITMFIDEAKIAVQLTHANVAQIYDLGKVDDAYFIAMEYIHGKDLRGIWDRLRKKGEFMSPEMAAFIIQKVCEGLDYAHRKKDKNSHDLNLVHRDVSPQNIIVSYEGEIKVIDFGIAKAARKSTKTQAGILKGKFGYMSPEQVRGLPIDRRSDVFAIGVVLYELVTGERLFIGSSDFSTLEKVRNVEIVPPTTYNKNLPKEMEDIILKSLTRDTEERYQWASEMATALQRFMLSFDKPYTGQELSAFMKTIFSADIAREGKKLKYFDKMGIPEQAKQQDDQGTGKILTASTTYSGALATSPGTPLPVEPPKPYDVFDPNLQGQKVAKSKGGPMPRGATPPPTNPRLRTPGPVRQQGATGPTPTPTPSNPRFQISGTGSSGPTIPYKKQGGGQTPTPTPGPRTGATKPRIQQQPGEQNQAGAGLELDISPHELRKRNVRRSPDEPSYGKAKIQKKDTTGKHRSPAYVSNVYPPISPRRKDNNLKKFAVIVGGIMLLGIVALYFIFNSDDSSSVNGFPPPDTTGTLSINTAPADAEIYLDAKKVAGKSPFESAPIDVGTHQLLIKRNGYKHFEKEIIIRPNNKTSEFIELKPLIEEYGNVYITSKPSGSVMTIDGRTLFDTTPFKLKKVVANVSHTILLSKIGFKDRKINFKVRANRTKNIDLTLKKALVNVTIYSNPSGAGIFKQGTQIGKTPYLMKNVPCSKEVTVTLGKTGRRTVSKTIKPHGVDCTIGRKKVIINLPRSDGSDTTGIRPSKHGRNASTAKTGTLDLISRPWAYITIDGKETGKTTPLMNYKLPAGEHEIHLKNKNFKFDRKFKITIKAGEKSSHREIGIQ